MVCSRSTNPHRAVSASIRSSASAWWYLLTRHPLNCGWRLSIVVAVLGITGCVPVAPVEGAMCNQQLGHPCPATYVCLTQKCTKKKPPVNPVCEADADCPVNQPFCFDPGSVGICVSCLTDSYCQGLTGGSCLPPAYICGCFINVHCLSGYCGPGGFCQGCTSGAQCDPGYICNDDSKCVIFQQDTARGGMESTPQ